MASPPKRIKLLHLDYDIKDAHAEHADLSKQYGWHDPAGQVIYLVPGMTLQRKREILFHEVGHALNDFMTLEGESDENLTSRLAVAWMTVLRDNPKLTEFLFDCKVNKRKARK
jgi:hypothetical protein